MEYVVGFIFGFLLYHFIMNRTIMMRRCCLEHFSTHAKCKCADCVSERVIQ
jgi:hypothetical protein